MGGGNPSSIAILSNSVLALTKSILENTLFFAALLMVEFLQAAMLTIARISNKYRNVSIDV